jgi:hypothetical protein
MFSNNRKAGGTPDQQTTSRAYAKANNRLKLFGSWKASRA